MEQSESGARRNRWNFRVLLIQGVTREVGYELSSEKLVLPFIYAALGGPLFYAGLMLSMVEFSKFGAQIVGSPLIAWSPRTKFIVGLTTVVAAAALMTVSLIALELPPHLLVVIFLAVSAIIGLCKGLNLLAFQDLLGRALFADSRPRLLFFTGAATGVLVILLALGAIFLADLEAEDEIHLELIWLGIGMLLLASLAILFLDERAKAGRPRSPERSPGHTPMSYLSELRHGLETVSGLAWFRQFLKARLLLTTVEVAMPFFAIHAVALHPETAPVLSLFVLAGSVGMIAGGFVWPGVSKRSLRLVMTTAPLLACVAVFGAITLQLTPSLRMPGTHMFVFGILTFAVQGVVVSRTVYLVDAASDGERPYCISLSNLAGGLFGFVLAIIGGSIVTIQGAIAALICMLPMNLAGALLAWRLEDPQRTRIE